MGRITKHNTFSNFLNTVGILEIVYLFVFAKIGFDRLFSLGGNTDKPGEIQA
jgi:hypothetical protein